MIDEVNTYLGNKEEYHQRANAQGNTDEPEPELPGEVLDDVTVEERSSASFVDPGVGGILYTDIRRALIASGVMPRPLLTSPGSSIKMNGAKTMLS